MTTSTVHDFPSWERHEQSSLPPPSERKTVKSEPFLRYTVELSDGMAHSGRECPGLVRCDATSESQDQW
jgi:hypothetical protein